MDHDFDKNDPFSIWIESLKRPDDPPPKGSCCGWADAYPIVIDQDAIGDEPDQMGYAHIGPNDGPMQYPDGSIRVGLPNGLKFRFLKSKVNPLADGNPTDIAWGFFSVIVGEGPGYSKNNIRYIYCIVQLPPGM